MTYLLLGTDDEVRHQVFEAFNEDVAKDWRVRPHSNRRSATHQDRKTYMGHADPKGEAVEPQLGGIP